MALKPLQLACFRALSLVAAAGLAGCTAAPTPRVRASSQPARALCTSAPLPLDWGSTLVSSTQHGVSLSEASCIRAAAPECLYLLDVPSRADVRISLLSSGFDGALALYDASGISELACVDDQPLGDTHHARIEVTLDPGQYLLVVDGASGGTGPFELFAELDPLPTAEQLCSALEPLQNGVYTRGSTRGGANVFSARCAGGAPGPDHAHAFTLATRSRVRLREHSEFDAVLSVRGTCADSASELACADDGAAGHTQLSAELPEGSYFAVVDGHSRADSGDYVLAFEQRDAPPVLSPTAACASTRPLLLDGSRQELDTFYRPAALAGSCGGDDAPEALFGFALTKRSLVEVELSDRELNPIVYLRKGCSEPADELACVVVPPVERERPGPQTVLSMQLEPGSYLLAVDGQQASDMGAATLRVTARAELSAAPRAP